MAWIFNTFVFVLGACIGSFLNCLAWRLYHNESLWGRSACPECHKRIEWYDNVPILSFIDLKGKCRHCQKHISFQYPIVELVTGALFILAWRHGLAGADIYYQLANFNFPALLGLIARDWLVISVLVVIFIMDLRWYVVADEISLPAIVIVGVVNLALGLSWHSLLTAAIVGAGFFALQYVVSRGRWVGGGDIRLGALMGVALGWPNTLVALMLAYFSGAAVGVFLILTKKKQMQSPIPFGVFLAPATLAALWWGAAIYHWYINLLF